MQKYRIFAPEIINRITIKIRFQMEKIVINPNGRKALVEKYGAANVSRALCFRSNSQMSKEIRHEAMNEYGGHIFIF
jgi:hypothetical protein